MTEKKSVWKLEEGEVRKPALAHFVMMALFAAWRSRWDPYRHFGPDRLSRASAPSGMADGARSPASCSR